MHHAQKRVQCKKAILGGMRSASRVMSFPTITTGGSSFRCIATIACLSVCNFAPAHAQEQDAGQRLLEEQQRQKRLEELARNRAGQEITTPDIKGVVHETPCFPIDKISLKGVTVFKEATFAKLTAEFAGQCIGQVSIGNLLGRISAAYADKGYITTRAYVPAQDISNRQLTIEVLEGRVEAFVYQQVDKDGKPKPGKPRKIKSAFPTRAGDVFQLRDVEHGLEQINRLRSSQANANLTAGQAPGTSQIVITEQKADPIRGTFGIDTKGDAVTGETQIRLGVEADDLFRLNDTWSFSYSGARQSNALAFSGSIPYRKWLFSMSGSYSESLSPVTATSDLFTQAANVNFSAERLMYRNARSKYIGYVTAKSYWNDRYVNIAALTPQHRSGLSFGLRHEHRLEKAVISADTSISIGSKFLSADWDATNLPAGSPRTDFEKLGTRLTYIRPLKKNRQLSVALTGQLSTAPLFSNEQISIGGWETVRGYSGHSFSGDSGAYIRNELSFPTEQLDIRKWGKPLTGKKMWNPFKRAQGGIRSFAFVDAGYVHARALDQSSTLMSAGFGVSAQLGLATLNGALAIPLLDRNGQKAGSPQAYLGLTIKLF